MKTLMQSMNKKEQITLLAIKKRQTNTIETVLKRQSRERSKLENKLRQEIITYMSKLERQVLTTYKKASEQGIPAHNIQTLIMMLIRSWHQEYTPLLDHYHQLIQKLASNQNNELIKLQQRKTLGLKRSKETLTLNPLLSVEDNPIKLLAVKVQTKLDDLLENQEPKHYIIKENKQITEQIRQSNFKFSEKTRQRVTNEINSIIAKSETEGIGPYQVSEEIQRKFAELKGYEANRIARTEINRADNTYRYDDIMNNKLIDYIQWYGHDDGKERDSHIKCNGEIIRKGELFSNGLRYPGDPHAPAKEVINCRCTIVPFIPPFDKMIPTGLDTFKEGDLLDKPEDVQQQFLLETIENTRIITPTDGGLNVNLDNISIGNVKETLGKLSQQTLDGYLKTKKQVQSTLDKLLGINKRTKPTGRGKLKKKLHDNWKTYKPTTLDDIQPLYNLNKSSEPVDIDKFEKKLEDNWKNVEPTSFDKQQAMYDIKTPTTKDVKQPSVVSNLQMNKKEVTTALPKNELTQKEMQKIFKEKNKDFSDLMEKEGLKLNKDYNFIEDSQGIRIQWNSHKSAEIKEKIDNLFERIAPTEDIYSNTNKILLEQNPKCIEETINAYTLHGDVNINEIYKAIFELTDIYHNKSKYIKNNSLDQWEKEIKELHDLIQFHINYLKNYFNVTGEHLARFNDSFSNECCKIPVDMVLYKGISNIDEKTLKVGYKSFFKNYNSTSHSIKVAKKFRDKFSYIPNEKRAIIEYHVDKNIWGMAIMGRGETPTESELLLKFGQKYEIISVEQMDDGTWYLICHVYR